MSDILKVNYENKPCYNIIFSYNFDELADCLIKISHGKSRKIAIVTDSNISKIYLDTVKERIQNKYNDIITFVIEAGEKNKTLANVQLLYEELIKNKFYRGDLLIALGGGVIGDLTGFAASTYLRGIDFVQVPTSLLSFVDSSIGGKTGVDFNSYKNMVGAFHMPKLVYINVNVLKTLPDIEFSSGMGEVIKHGLIRNKDYFDWIYDNKESILNKYESALTKMIYESCKVKRDVVEIDPKEMGLRAILNFGHTLGHAIEKLCNFTMSHGQCVSLGYVAAAKISENRGLIGALDIERIKEINSYFGLRNSCRINSLDDVILATKSDKKMTNDGIKFILLNSIGEASICKDVTDEELLIGLKEIYDE